MNKRELVQRTAAVMRENNIRKPISAYKKVLHISDDDGNASDFVIKKSEKDVIYTVDDIESVLDVCMEVIKEALKCGEPISVRGFGTLALHYRKARTTKHPETGEYVPVPERYVPKFTFGNDLRMCAKMFELSLNDVPSEYMMDTDEGGDTCGD